MDGHGVAELLSENSWPGEFGHIEGLVIAGIHSNAGIALDTFLLINDYTLICLFDSPYRTNGNAILAANTQVMVNFHEMSSPFFARSCSNDSPTHGSLVFLADASTYRRVQVESFFVG
jgi:hypothetical protein